MTQTPSEQTLRTEMLSRLKTSQGQVWDLLVIGGGATGLGIALDAASRGLNVILCEQSDFAKSTSSKSTKLIHGGVRYLAQGNISLVFEGLHERGLLKRNAPDLVNDQTFVIPAYHYWQLPFYGVGLKIYDSLAGKLNLEGSKFLSTSQVKELLPNISTEGLKGGISYHDGQFNDARLALCLGLTAVGNGACVLNYIKINGFEKEQSGKIISARCKDSLSGEEYLIRAKTFVNATGVFVDDVLRMVDANEEKSIAPSQGSHIVVDQKFSPGKGALLIPQTSDGRVLFVVPWLSKVIIGTTDIPVENIELDPWPRIQEIEFILSTASRYLDVKPKIEDIRSVFSGLRPLSASGSSSNSKDLSRSHHIVQHRSGLITITGGKWTTYRRMAEDVVNLVSERLNWKSFCRTAELPLTGCNQKIEQIQKTNPNPESTNANIRFHPDLPCTGSDVVNACIDEMAMRCEDILARRTRCLFLDAKATLSVAPKVIDLMAKVQGRDESWRKAEIESFNRYAQQFIIN